MPDASSSGFAKAAAVAISGDTIIVGDWDDDDKVTPLGQHTSIIGMGQVGPDKPSSLLPMVSQTICLARLYQSTVTLPWLVTATEPTCIVGLEINGDWRRN